MKNRKNVETDLFSSSLYKNAYSWREYYDYLLELAISIFEWENLPDSIDEQRLEYLLCTKGQALFFKDSDLDAGTFLALEFGGFGGVDFNNIPIKRIATAPNAYTNNELDTKNSVIIYNSPLRQTTTSHILYASLRLWELDRIIDININAQKTPLLICCDETQRLSMLNLYKEYSGNAPIIFGNKNITREAIQTLNTDCAFKGKELFAMRQDLLNDILTKIGILNVNYEKKERLISDEVLSSQGALNANRAIRLSERKKACERINKMFGLNLNVKFRDEIEIKKVGEEKN